MLKIDGSNPWTVTYTPPPGLAPPWQSVAVRWRLVAASGSACLAREAAPVAGSGVALSVKEPEYDATGALTGYRDEKRSAPQSIKVVLSCGECTCGGQFSVAVECDVATFQQQPITAWTTEATTLAIHCAGPGCEGVMVVKDTPLAKPLEDEPKRQ